MIAATLRNHQSKSRGTMQALSCRSYYRLSTSSGLLVPSTAAPPRYCCFCGTFFTSSCAACSLADRWNHQAARACLLRFDFPGLTPKLENPIERTVVRTITPAGCDGSIRLLFRPVAADHQRVAATDEAADSDGDVTDLSVKAATARLEQRLIARALHKTRGNRTAAAKLLGLSHRALCSTSAARGGQRRRKRP